MGGYSGAILARWVGQVVVRRLVIGIGLVISAVLFLRLLVQP